MVVQWTSCVGGVLKIENLLPREEKMMRIQTGKMMGWKPGRKWSAIIDGVCLRGELYQLLLLASIYYQ